MASFFHGGHGSAPGLPLRSRAKGQHEDGLVGKPATRLGASRMVFPIWLMFVHLALHVPSLLGTFAIPKQPPIRLQREKEGLIAYIPAGKDFADVINEPGVQIEPTSEEKRLASRIKENGNGEPGQWKRVRQILDKYSGYSPLVLNAGMQAALRCRMYKDGARVFERLRQAQAPMTLPVYTTAMKLYGKLLRQDEVRDLWQELVRFDAVNRITAQGCIDACADMGNIRFAGEVLEYMENQSTEADVLHFTSAINACANSKGRYRAKAAKSFLASMVEKKMNPNIVTYSCALRSMRGSPGQDLLDLLASMKVQGVKANSVFAESFFYIFLKQPEKGSWTSKAAVVADLRKLPRDDLETAKGVMDELVVSGVKLNASCRRIKAALESLL